MTKKIHNDSTYTGQIHTKFIMYNKLDFESIDNSIITICDEFDLENIHKKLFNTI